MGNKGSSLVFELIEAIFHDYQGETYFFIVLDSESDFPHCRLFSKPRTCGNLDEN